MDQEKLKILTAIVLGDGCITPIKQRPGNYQLSVKHCTAQLGWLTHKRDIVENLLQKRINIRASNSVLNGKTFGNYRFRISSSSDECFKYLRDELYSTGRKLPTVDALTRIDNQGLAILYMDNGSYGKVPSSNKVSNVLSDNIVLCTCYPKQYAEMTASVLNSTFGITFRLYRDNPRKDSYSLRLLSSSVNRFFEIVGSYIQEVPCMNYKMKVRNSTSAGPLSRDNQGEDIVRPCRKLQEAGIKSLALASNEACNISELDRKRNRVNPA